MLESDALKCICPFAQLVSEGNNIFSNLGQQWLNNAQPIPYCIGSGCMAWVVRQPPGTAESSGACGLITGVTGIFP